MIRADVFDESNLERGLSHLGRATSPTMQAHIVWSLQNSALLTIGMLPVIFSLPTLGSENARKASHQGVQICPAQMQSSAGSAVSLSGFSIMKFSTDTGWHRLSPEGGEEGRRWSLPIRVGTRYRGVCEYDDEIIGVSIEEGLRECRLRTVTSISSGTSRVVVECNR